MNEIRFHQIVEAYGADPARWPEAERDAAQDFVRDHGETARPVLAEAGSLDALLGRAERTASPALEAALLDQLPGAQRRFAARGARGRAWVAPMAMAAGLVLAVMLAWVVADPNSRSNGPVYTEYTEYYEGFGEDWVDWLGGDV
ncbi:hypothetical protein [Maricaulis sp. CAU 1757]